VHFGALVSLPVADEPFAAYAQTTVFALPSLAIVTEPLNASAITMLLLEASDITVLPCDACALTMPPLVASAWTSLLCDA
jgi:hypothetical protein